MDDATADTRVSGRRRPLDCYGCSRRRVLRSYGRIDRSIHNHRPIARFLDGLGAGTRMSSESQDTEIANNPNAACGPAGRHLSEACCCASQRACAFDGTFVASALASPLRLSEVTFAAEFAVAVTSSDSLSDASSFPGPVNSEAYSCEEAEGAFLGRRVQKIRSSK